MLLFFLWLFSFKFHFHTSLSTHSLSFTYPIFSPPKASHVTTGCPCSSTYHFPPYSLFFLSHTYCCKPISQIGSRGPIAHLGVSRQGPKLEAVKSEGAGTPYLLQLSAAWLEAALGADRKVLGESGSAPVVNAV